MCCHCVIFWELNRENSNAGMCSINVLFSVHTGISALLSIYGISSVNGVIPSERSF